MWVRSAIVFGVLAMLSGIAAAWTSGPLHAHLIGTLGVFLCASVACGLVAGLTA